MCREQLAVLMAQLQEQHDSLPSIQRSLADIQAQTPHAAGATGIAATAAGLLRDTLACYADNQQQLDAAALAACVGSNHVALSDQQQLLQGQVMAQVQQQQAALQTQNNSWERAVAVFEKAADALAVARAECAGVGRTVIQSGLEQGCVPDSAYQLLMDAAAQLSDVLEASSGCTLDATAAGGLLAAQASAQTAVGDVANVLQEVAEALAAAARPTDGWAGGPLDAAEGSILQDLASSIVQAEAVLRDRTKVRSDLQSIEATACNCVRYNSRVCTLESAVQVVHAAHGGVTAAVAGAHLLQSLHMLGLCSFSCTVLLSARTVCQYHIGGLGARSSRGCCSSAGPAATRRSGQHSC